MPERADSRGATQMYAVREEKSRNEHHPQHTRTVQPAAVIENNGEPTFHGNDFPSRVVTEGMRSLFIPLPNLRRSNISNCEINLATLQRMNIHAIQRDLIQLVGKIVRSGRMETRSIDREASSQAVQVRELMKEYCEYRLSFAITSHAQ